MKNAEPLVSISCITYNHAPYIRQCLDGFLMQQTNFAYEVLIHDDCSTDGTTEIIKEYETRYPDIVKPMYEVENQYQQGKPSGSAVWNFPRARGKYMALCEGDDFWIDPLKLQKEVDVLENDSNVMLVHTGFKTVDNAGNEITRPFFDECMSKSKNGYVVDLLMRGNYILSLTTCFRLSAVNNPSCLFEYNGPKIDYYLFMKLALQGKVSYIPDITGAYRNNPNGMVATAKNMILNTFKEVYKLSFFNFIDSELKFNYSILCRFKIYCMAWYRAIKWFYSDNDKLFLKRLIKMF